MPSGPVTFGKAWIEMIHRYLAMTVGALILVLARGQLGLRAARLPLSPWWPTATLAWVIVQGLFGKYTVTLKLYPADRHAAPARRAGAAGAAGGAARGLARPPLRWPPRCAAAAGGGVALLLVLQIALGGWVSTNYAVLACSGFPHCNGSGGRRWTSATASRCCANWAAPATAASCPSRRWWRSTWRTALFALLAGAALLALALRLWHAAGAAPRGAGCCWR